MIGIKLYKNGLNDDEYFNAALWCNENGARIEDKGDFFEVVAIPAPTLKEVKAEKIDYLKKERDTLEIEAITVDGYTYDYDDKARERINNAIIALQASGGSVYWTMADQQSKKVNAADLIAVVSAVAIRSNALHIAYRMAKQAVIDAETVEQAQAVRLEIVADTEAGNA